MSKFVQNVEEEGSLSGQLCNDCKYNNRDSTCEAFPDGIPAAILNNTFTHYAPYPGQQNELVYSPFTDTPIFLQCGKCTQNSKWELTDADMRGSGLGKRVCDSYPEKIPDFVKNGSGSCPFYSQK
jgi:hypothetical protein